MSIDFSFLKLWLKLRLVQNLEKEASHYKCKSEIDECDENITRLLRQALKITEKIPDIQEKVLKKLAFRSSRHSPSLKGVGGKAQTSSKSAKSKAKKSGKINENNKMRLHGASCVMKTSDVVSTIDTYNPSIPGMTIPDNFESDLSWLSSALSWAKEPSDETSVFISFANSLAMRFEANVFGNLPREEQILLLLYGLMALEKSVSVDESQTELKIQTFSLLTEKIADLQGKIRII